MIHSLLPKTAAEVQDEIALSARARRLAKNITQEDLAEQSGVAIATLRRFENGGTVNLATLLAIAEALGTLDAFSDLFPCQSPLPWMNWISLVNSVDAQRSRGRDD